MHLTSRVTGRQSSVKSALAYQEDTEKLALLFLCARQGQAEHGHAELIML